MRKTTALVAILMVFTVLAASGSVQASDTQIELTTSKQNYAIGELVEITMTNTGNEREPIYEGKSIINVQTGEVSYVVFTSDFGEIQEYGTASDDFYIV